jgi:signal transduction histidine kinase
VAHDFNNLLTVIMGYVEILAEEVSGRPQLAHCTLEIQYAANRAVALTTQLLAFGRRKISPVVLALNDKVNDSLHLLEKSAKRSKPRPAWIRRGPRSRRIRSISSR